MRNKNNVKKQLKKFDIIWIFSLFLLLILLIVGTLHNWIKSIQFWGIIILLGVIFSSTFYTSLFSDLGTKGRKILIFLLTISILIVLLLLILLV